MQAMYWLAGWAGMIGYFMVDRNIYSGSQSFCLKKQALVCGQFKRMVYLCGVLFRMALQGEGADEKGIG